MAPKYPMVVSAPNHYDGAPTVGEYSTSVLAELHRVGELVEAIYPDVTRHMLLVAIWFEGKYGEERFRRLWGDWARQHQFALSRPATLDPYSIPVPPADPTWLPNYPPLES